MIQHPWALAAKQSYILSVVICSSSLHCRQIKINSPQQLAKNLSGGNQQKLVLAKWLESNADIIIFDEPTTALDVTTQVNVLATIRSIVKEHQTSAIYKTHDLAVF